MKYFENNLTKRCGLPWLDSRSSWEKSRDAYFENLEELVEQIDDVESNTSFISDLMPYDFDNGYQFVLGRIKELKRYLKRDAIVIDNEYLIETLEEIYNNLLDLETDSLLYEDVAGDEEFEGEDDEDDNMNSEDSYESEWNWEEDDDGDEKNDYEW